MLDTTEGNNWCLLKYTSALCWKMPLLNATAASKRHNSNYTTSWMVQVSNPSRDNKHFSSPKCSDWLWGPPNLIFNWTRVLSWAPSGQGLMLTNHLHLLVVLRLWISRAICLLPPYAIMAWRGTTFNSRQYIKLSWEF